MACDICGKNIGRFEGKRLDAKNYYIKVCTDCDALMQKLKQGDLETYNKVHELVEDMPMSTQMFVSAWETLPEEIAKERELAKQREEEERLKKEEEFRKRKEERQQQKEEALRQRAEKLRQFEESKEQFMETTGYNFEGYKIVEYLGIKSGEIVLGTGIVAEILGGITDLLGDSSFIMSSKLTKAKSMALKQLMEACIISGANAVIGVDIDIMALEQNQMVVCANGTAVKIEKL